MAESKIQDIVIGSGITGVLIAYELERSGRNVLLIDENEDPMEKYSSMETQWGPIDHFLQKIPATEKNIKYAAALVDFLKTEIQFEVKELLPPTHYQKGQFQPFVGFGEDAPKFLDLLNPWLVKKEIIFSKSIEKITKEIYEKLGSEKLLLSRVTRIHLDEDENASITVNGKKKYAAERIISTISPINLPGMLESSALGTKNLTQIRKAPLWTSIKSIFVHKGESPFKPGTHILMGQHEEAIPCIGDSQNHNDYSVSEWVTYVDKDHSEDDENTAQALKEIKKQIKRAYPNSLDNLLFEKVLVSPASQGQVHLNLKSAKIKGAKNLFLTHGQLTDTTSPLSEVYAAFDLLNIFGSDHNVHLSNPTEPAQT